MPRSAGSPIPRSPKVLDVERIRADFPPLTREIHGHPLVYLDSAATSLTPVPVLDALNRYFREMNANVHRGVHRMAEEATAAYEGTREVVAQALGGVSPRGVVFTRGATEALNLMAYSYGRRRLVAGDEILITEMEHHSNQVPWLEAARVTGAKVRVAPIHDDGHLDIEAFHDLLGPRTRIVAMTHRSNVLGTTNPIAELAAAAKTVGALVVVDGSQAVPHQRVDLNGLPIDAYAFTGHKAFGPTGVGVLWARPELLEEMDPFLGGGEMIRHVAIDKLTFNDVPWKFEAGTPPIAEVIALGEALRYLDALGLEELREHELGLTRQLLDELKRLPDMRILGSGVAEDHDGIVSFRDANIHAHDLATILDRHGVAVRAGHHCAQPLMRRMGVEASVRASFHAYCRKEDVDRLLAGIHDARKTFQTA